MAKATIYIRKGNEERWADKNKYHNHKSDWVNKMLVREAEEERREAMARPVFDEVTQTWSDSE